MKKKLQSLEKPLFIIKPLIYKSGIIEIIKFYKNFIYKCISNNILLVNFLKSKLKYNLKIKIYYYNEKIGNKI